MGNIQKLTNGTTGGPVFVYVQDGKVIRITPMEFDGLDAPSWVIKARGREFPPPRKPPLSPYSFAWRSMIYSPTRLLHPLKRVDFDPGGKRNCTKRGESGYEEISWGWGGGKVTRGEKTEKRGGGHWGGMHMWGFSHRLGIPEQYDLLEDALKNTEMIVFWSSDPETTSGIYSAFESTCRRQWLKDLGVKMIFVAPFFNHTAGLLSDKWFAPRLGTDNALACAIAYVWITENLYDKEYIRTRTVGFEKWMDYILGKEDGVPKTPEWAEKESTIPAREIKALAREWGTKKTMLAAGGLGGWGGACRSAGGGGW